MNFNVSGSGESTWYATIRMPEDVVVNSVYVECVGNSRHPSKSNSSILPSSISISAGITNSQMSHAGTTEFKQIRGKTTQNKKIGTSVNAGQSRNNEVTASRLLQLTFTTTSNALNSLSKTANDNNTTKLSGNFVATKAVENAGKRIHCSEVQMQQQVLKVAIHRHMGFYQNL